MSEVKPPKHLSKSSKEFFAHVTRAYSLEAHHLVVLVGACEAMDRCELARVAIETDGMLSKDRYGQLRQHPAIPIERDSRLSYVRMLRELGLDISEPADNRPPTISGNHARRFS